MTAIVCQRDAWAGVSHVYADPLPAQNTVLAKMMFHDVWQCDFDREFSALLGAVSRAGGSEAILAMDMEFPGFLYEDPQFASDEAHHEALRSNIDLTWPIQVGIAVVGVDGMHHGVWTFNLEFDADVDAHTARSLAFLRQAGLDFPRHRTTGISRLVFGQRLLHSILVGAHAPRWLTFSGSYDWGYLLKLVTFGRALPGEASTYRRALSIYCPVRQDLRDFLPEGSLEVLGRRHGVTRRGRAHTAGSDALLTAELFVLLASIQSEIRADAKLEGGQHELWCETPYAYPSDVESWHENTSADWEGGAWMPQSQAYNDCVDFWDSPSWNSFGIESW